MRLLLPSTPVCGAVVAAFVMLGVHARSVAAQPRDTEIGRPITLPGDQRPPQPAGELPKSCLTLPNRDRVAHWERQSTLLSRLVTSGGVDLRVANARATLVARRDLARLDLAAFAAEPQAVGELTLDQRHNGLPPGRYCLVSVVDRQALSAPDPNDRRWWRMFLYDLDHSQAPAAAYVPFVYRVDAKSQPREHPANVSAPQPPARFELTLRQEYRERSSRPGRDPADRAFFQLQRDWLAMSTWYTCGAAGCCTGGVEALQAY